jgi:hypothetical protein
MTLQPLPSGFPHIGGKFCFLFYQCMDPYSFKGLVLIEWFLSLSSLPVSILYCKVKRDSNPVPAFESRPDTPLEIPLLSVSSEESRVASTTEIYVKHCMTQLKYQ